jgi:soluble lytic murein transglycosylase-like protein
MARLIALGALAVLALSAMPVKAAPPDPWTSFVAEAAHRFGIPDAWIKSVMHAESAGRTTLHGQPITSSAGAMGLMQVMPGTYRDMRGAYHLGADAYDPHDNILAGTAYLRAMYGRFGYPGLFAAYNAGPGRYDAYLRGEAVLPAETSTYIAKLAPAPSGVMVTAQNPSASALFVHLDAPVTRLSAGLFVPLRTATTAGH